LVGIAAKCRVIASVLHHGICIFGLCMMARTHRQLAILHRAQLAADRLFGDGDPELIMP